MGFFETSGKAAKFENTGDTYTGVITRPYREAQSTKYGTTEPDFWPDGAPKMQAIVDLQTDRREGEDDDGVRTLYIAAPRQRRAITDAVRKAGASDLEPGGKLTITFTGFDPKSKNPANPAKQYTAAYEKPSRVGSLGVAPTAPVTQAASYSAPAAPAAPAGGLSPADTQKARDLIAMGLDDATVAAALGSNLAVVQGIRASI